VQLVLGRAAHVDPHDGVVFGQVIGDVGNREVLGLDDTVAVDAGGCGRDVVFV